MWLNTNLSMYSLLLAFVLILLEYTLLTEFSGQLYQDVRYVHICFKIAILIKMSLKFRVVGVVNSMVFLKLPKNNYTPISILTLSTPRAHFLDKSKNLLWHDYLTL